MRKILLCFIMMALILSVFGCKKTVDDKPGYVPPDLTYPGNDNIDTEPSAPGVDQTLPFDTDPSGGGEGVDPVDTTPKETKAPETTPKVTDPAVTQPVVTTPKETEPQATEPDTTEPKETEPSETEDDFVVPDVIIVPTEIPYVLTSVDGYFEFIYRPDPGYFSKGVNIYYSVPGEEGVVHMNKLDNYGFMKYIGEHKSGQYDLHIDLINFVLSGELQDVLVNNRINPDIIYIGGVACLGPDGIQQFIWVRTPKDDFIVAFGDSEDEILIYTHESFMKEFED